MRFIFATLLAILPAAALAEPLSFDEALARAANSAPLLEAREQQIRARQSAAIAAGPLPDPTLDRKRVGAGKSVSVRVDLGGSRIINKKTKQKKNITR